MIVEFAKNVFLPGETLYCKVTMKNESSKTVKALKLKLVREVTIKAKGRSKFLPSEASAAAGVRQSERRRRTAHAHVVQMQRKVFPGCGPKTAAEVMCDIVVRSAACTSARASLTDASAPQLAPQIFPSTESQLIKNAYHLTIECDVPMAVRCGDDKPLSLTAPARRATSKCIPSSCSRSCRRPACRSCSTPLLPIRRAGNRVNKHRRESAWRSR